MARPPRRRPVGPPPWLILTLVIFVALPIGGAIYSAVKDSNPEGATTPRLSRSGSVQIAPADRHALAFTTEPASYDLTYRIERYDPDKVQLSRDHIQVRRPFDARITTEIDGKVVGLRASRFGSLALSTGSGPKSVVSPPSPATGDVRLLTALPEAVVDKYVDVRERRKVAGRECQVYRLGSTVSSGELTPVHTTAGEYADACVDANGMLLEEVWVKGGRAIQRRVAQKLETDVAFDDELFTIDGEQPLGSDLGNGFTRTLDPASGFEGTFYRLASGPEGFAYRGRFLVQPPRLSPFRDQVAESTSSTPEQVSMIDVWELGADIVTLSQTIAADISAVPANAKTAQPFDIGIDGVTAATVLDLRANEVRLELPEARFLRLAGTRSRAELVDLARALRAEVGTGPVVRD